MHKEISDTVRNSLTINKMVTVRTVNLRNSWYYKKSNNPLQIGTYSKKFPIPEIVNGTIRNGYEYDSTCHTWILLMKICCCTTKTLVAFKCQLFSCCARVLSRIIYRWTTHSRNVLLSKNQLGILHVVMNRS